jgi:alpha-ketoglutaric semialdehyde dehydrogenase
MRKFMANVLKNYINGQWIGSEKTFEQRNPADLGEITGIWPALSREDTCRAVESAAAAFPAWSALSAYGRAEFLKKAHRVMVSRREELARVITMENGKLLKESFAEVDSAIREMEYQIHEGVRVCGRTVPSAQEGVFACELRVPLGAVAVISPWNFPLNVLVRKVTPALMAGNTCVYKPASLTPMLGQKYMELFIEAGLPAGVLNFVTGSGGEAGDALVTHPKIRAVSFTGSTSVGRRIHEQAAKTLSKTQLEMGGKNPIVVLADADLESAVKSAVTAAYTCAGQWCTATSRAIVEKSIAKQFIDMVLAEVSAITVGNGLDPDAKMGPVCGAEQKRTVSGYIETGISEGATLAAGGLALGGEFSKGCFIPPTVFTNVTRDMKIAREEIFGPVLAIMEAADFNEAVEIANDVEFGLTSSIYTKDLSKAFTFLEKSDVGFAHVNMMTAHKEPQLSLGGVKQSGFGVPEAGQTGLEFFTEHKVAYIKYR